MPHQTANLRISHIGPVDSPAQVSSEFPLNDDAASLVAQTRQAIHDILNQSDDRLIVIVGPCSIHDPKAALEYAQKLLPLRHALQDDLLILMRVYFEKPRTRVGWKGLINDPGLDETFDINRGVRIARQLLVDLNNLGMPAGTEFLDIVTGQYYSDLISWGAIGARTTESQVHRELASGLSCPVGFKNGTDGNLDIACDAMIAAAEPHIFLSPTTEGKTGIFTTTGNADTHIILRGGTTPNYDAEHVKQAVETLRHNGLSARIMIDLSHGNSQKQFARQREVGADVASQITSGNRDINGVMIESHLVEGKQQLVERSQLVYGQSITDGCLSFDDTKPLLESLAAAVQKRRSNP